MRLIAASALLIASPVCAQGLDTTPDRLAVEAMLNFGHCVARQTPAGARKLLAMDFRTEAYGKVLQRLARGHGRCAPNSRIRFDGILFAGAMAEALVEAEGTPAQLTVRLARNPARAPIPARSALETMALCTVFASPRETAGLLATGPGSRDEAIAVKALAPTLETCLAKGHQAELNRPGLRSVLALAAWRIASTPVGTGQVAQ